MGPAQAILVSGWGAAGAEVQYRPLLDKGARPVDLSSGEGARLGQGTRLAVRLSELIAEGQIAGEQAEADGEAIETHAARAVARSVLAHRRLRGGTPPPSAGRSSGS